MISWCTATGIMDDMDMERSSGEMIDSADVLLRADELLFLEGASNDLPHANKVLHHELVQRLCRVSHVYLSFPVAKIGLQTGQTMLYVEKDKRRTFSVIYVKAAAWSRWKLWLNESIVFCDNLSKDILCNENSVDSTPVKFVDKR